MLQGSRWNHMTSALSLIKSPDLNKFSYQELGIIGKSGPS